MSQYIGMEAHGVIEACLDMARAMGRSPVKVAYAEGDGLGTALEVRSHRSAKETELILLSRLHTNDRAGGEHIGAQVQGSIRAVGRHPFLVGCHYLIHCFQEPLLGESRHFQPFG